MDPNQSASTSIGLTSGWVYPLKNLPYSCKYSAGATLKVWGDMDAIATACLPFSIWKFKEVHPYLHYSVVKYFKVKYNILLSSI